jgi:hypothetical protein
MKLIPQWRRWWRRHSVHVLALIPLIEALRQWVPTVREFISPEVYGWAAGCLSLTAVVLMNIQQNALSGGSKNGDS